MTLSRDEAEDEYYDESRAEAERSGADAEGSESHSEGSGARVEGSGSDAEGSGSDAEGSGSDAWDRGTGGDTIRQKTQINIYSTKKCNIAQCSNLAKKLANIATTCADKYCPGFERTQLEAGDSVGD